jgi:hypothetical protein
MPGVAPLDYQTVGFTQAVKPRTTSTSSASNSCGCSQTYNLQCEQGATLSSQITITLNAAPVDVTGSEFQFTAKLNPSDADTAPTTVMVDWQETSTPTQGITWLVIPAATTQTMQLAGYSYQVRMVSSSGVVTPIVRGVLTIVQPVSTRFD